MGLDMYLYKCPKVTRIVDGVETEVSIQNCMAVESLHDYKEYLKRENGEEKCSFSDWTSASKYLPDDETVDKLSHYLTMRYYAWDNEHKYGRMMISEQIGYWRKVNAIHKWFVDNVQDGEDDCGYYEVTASQLNDLLDTCKEVLDSISLVRGKILTGYTGFPKEFTPNYEDGEVIEDTSVAEELLPTTSGFFFGGTDYNQYYVEYLKDTVQILESVLSETDFSAYKVYYNSSW